VISEAQKRENDRIISGSINHTKVWQIKKRYQGIIKKKSKKFFKNRFHDSYNSKYIPHKFNAFFIEKVDRMLNQNKYCKFGYDTLKLAKVRPIHNKGGKHEISNYRSISNFARFFFLILWEPG
jgi:hypothetical protein